jgi:hypothetical protein
MVDVTKLRAELRAGLDGVTPGPWEWDGFHYQELWQVGTYTAVFGWDAEQGMSLAYENKEANAAHIARCSPENIRALLDALDDAERGLTETKRKLEGAKDRAEKAERERDEARAELAQLRGTIEKTRNVDPYNQLEDRAYARAIKAIRDRTP